MFSHAGCSLLGEDADLCTVNVAPHQATTACMVLLSLEMIRPVACD